MPGRPIGRTLPLEGSSCQFESGTGNQRRFHWRVAQSVVRSALTRKVGGSYPPSPAILRQQKNPRKVVNFTGTWPCVRVAQVRGSKPRYGGSSPSVASNMRNGRGICGCAVDSKSTEVGPTPADRANSESQKCRQHGKMDARHLRRSVNSVTPA